MMTDEQERLLKKYAQAVLDAPKHFHLTSIRDSQLFWDRHIMDSMKLLEQIPPHLKEAALKVLDVGSGNGIPGIPFSIIMPHWQVDLVDSDNKKSLFIDTFCINNAINNVKMHIGRAETFARGFMRSSYDLVTARALSKLPVSLELTIPFLKIGGILIVPHGTSWQSELVESQNALNELGLKEPAIYNYRIGDGEYVIMTFTKQVETPSRYPRAVGIPTKRPL